MSVSIADLAIRVDASQLRQAQTETQRLSQNGRELDNTANRLSGSWSRFGSVLASIGLGLGVRQIIEYMDTWNNLEGRLRLVTKSTQDLMNVQSQLFNVANSSRAALEGTVDLYSKLARSQNETGLSSSQLVEITDAVNKSMIISGSGAQQAAAAILQLGQSFASGVLAGDEFKSVAENAPRLIRAIAEGWKNADGSIGVSIAKIRELSRLQQLDTESIAKALLRSTATLSSEFSKMPVTIGQAFTKVNNELLKFIGVGGQTSGVASALASAVLVLAENIETIAGSILIAVGAWATYKVALLGISFAGFIAGVGSSIASLQAYDEALAMNSVFSANNNVATARHALTLTESTVATNAAAVATAQLTISDTQLSLATLALARAEAIRNVNIAESSALLELQAIIESNLLIAQTELLNNQIALTAANQAHSLATSELNIALAAQTTAQSGVAASTTLVSRAMAFLGNVILVVKRELLALVGVLGANPFALFITSVVAAGTALYLFRKNAIGTTENEAVIAFKNNMENAARALNAGTISGKQFNEELEKQRALVFDIGPAVVELGDYFVGTWNIIKSGAIEIGIVLKQTFGGFFQWLESVKPKLSEIFDIKMPDWLKDIADRFQAEAEAVAKARKIAEDAAAAQDLQTRGLSSITEQGLKFNKRQEELYAKLIDQSNKLTISEHDRLLKEINDSHAVGKEREAMLALLAKIDDAKAKGLKNGEVEKSQIKEIQDLAKSSIDAQIADIKRLTEAKLQSYSLESDILKNQYDDNLITTKQFHDARIALINAERDANISALNKTQEKYKQSFEVIGDLQKATQALMQIESGGNRYAISTTKDGRHAIGSMQTLPSTLAGYGVDMGGLTDKSSREDLLGWLKTANNAFIAESTGVQMYAELVEKLGGNFSNAAAAYNEGLDNFKKYGVTAGENANHVIKFNEVFNSNSQDAIELSNKVKDAEASRFSANINATKEVINFNRELKKSIEEYNNSIQSSKIKYLEMTGQMAQASIEAEKLTIATDNIRKRAVSEGDNEAIKFIDALRTINPDIKPLQDKIKQYGLLEFQVTQTLKAELEEAKLNPANQAQLDFINAKIVGYTTLADLQKQESRQSITNQLLDELTDSNTKKYVENLKTIREAQVAGVNPDIINDYADKIKQEFDLNSPAGLQVHEFFNVLKETSSQGFEAMLKNGKSASEAMKDMFINMADNIAASFLKLGQNSLFDWIETGILPEGGLRNIAIAGLSVGASLLAGLFSADQPTRTASTAESYRSGELGASQMALIDSLSRDVGFNFATKAATIFNRNMEDFSRAVQNNAGNIFDGLSYLADEIAATQTFQNIASWLGTLGDGVSKITSLLGEGFKLISDFYTGSVNSIATYLGVVEKAGEVASDAGTISSKALSETVGKALAVVGAIYSIYAFATSIGDIVEYGTLGQVVGSVLQLVGALTTAATVLFFSGNVVGMTIGAVIGIVGFLISLFSSPRSPLIMLTSIGNDIARFEGIKKIQFPSGRGAIRVSSDFGTTELRSQYNGGLNADQLANAAGPLLEILKATDNAIAKALDKIDTQKQTTNYIRAKLNQYIEQNLDGADVSKMIDARYNLIADLAGQSGTKAGVIFNKIFDILMDKFKAFDKNTLAAMGVAASIAGNLQNFIDTVPLSFWDLVNKRIIGVGDNRTGEEFTNDLQKSILGFVALKEVLKTIGDISDDAIVAIMDAKGSIDTVALNMAQFVISLKSINPSITIDQVIQEINKIKESTKNLSDQQSSAFFSTFGVFSKLFDGIPINVYLLKAFSYQMLMVAQKTTQAANNAINYAIAENHLAGISRESAIQTLLRTKAIDDATVAESNLALAVQQATKAQLDSMGFIQTFVIATGKTLSDFNVTATAWFEAGKNVVAIFGDMKAAADFYTKISGAFLSDDEQKRAANEIAKNNVRNLIDAANQANLGDKLGIKTLTAENLTEWITKLLKSGVGIDQLIASFADVNQGSLFKSLFEALAQLKETTEALAGATDKLTDAQRKQTAATLDEWLQKNKIGSLSSLSDLGKNAEFVQQIKSTYASALQGNTKAAGSITGLIDEYLQFSQKFNPANYDDIVAWARSLIANLEDKLLDGSHADGLSNVPFDGYIAKLHQGERVLTKTESNNYSNKDNSETVRLLIELIKTEREGFRRVLTELQVSNKNSNDLKASARRQEVRA